MASLSGLRVIVAGAATGIGATTARLLAQRGAQVVLGDINAPTVQEVAEQINSSGGKATAVPFDLGNEESIKSLVENGVEALGGRLNGLVNMAADLRQEIVGQDCAVDQMDVAVWRRTLEVNLTGYALTTKYAIPHLRQNGSGSIVNISSATVYEGEPTRPAYAASKAGVHVLTRHTARILGPNNIRANAISFGGIATPKVKAMLETSEHLQNIRDSAPLRRFGEPEEPASLILYLLSQEASYVTGQVWSVNGGSHWRE